MKARARSSWTINGVGTLIISTDRARPTSNPTSLKTTKTDLYGHIPNMTEPCAVGEVAADAQGLPCSRWAAQDREACSPPT
jgi:hypothetical protein